MMYDPMSGSWCPASEPQILETRTWSARFYPGRPNLSLNLLVFFGGWLDHFGREKQRRVPGLLVFFGLSSFLLGVGWTVLVNKSSGTSFGNPHRK